MHVCIFDKVKQQEAEEAEVGSGCSSLAKLGHRREEKRMDVRQKWTGCWGQLTDAEGKGQYKREELKKQQGKGDRVEAGFGC